MVSVEKIVKKLTDDDDGRQVMRNPFSALFCCWSFHSHSDVVSSDHDCLAIVWFTFRAQNFHEFFDLHLSIQLSIFFRFDIWNCIKSIIGRFNCCLLYYNSVNNYKKLPEYYQTNSSRTFIYKELERFISLFCIGDHSNF